MKVVMPRGRENETLDAKFDVMPYAGCACSYDKVKEEWATQPARERGGSGSSCQCDCLYGTVNKVANDQVGRDSSER